MSCFTSTRKNVRNGQFHDEDEADEPGSEDEATVTAATTRSTPMPGLFRSLLTLPTGRSCAAPSPLRRMPEAA